MANAYTSEYYSFVLYSEDWAIHEVFDCCEKSCLPCYISPLHKEDVHTADSFIDWLHVHNEKILKSFRGSSMETLIAVVQDAGGELPSFHVGELKKPHWHILVQLPRRYGKKQALEVMREYFPLFDIRYVRGADYKYSCLYWSHLNAPSKAQYNPKDALSVNGFVPDLTFVQAFKPKQDILLDIMSYINSNKRNISLYTLIYHFREIGAYNVIEYIEKHTFLVCRLIDDRKGAF